MCVTVHLGFYVCVCINCLTTMFTCNYVYVHVVYRLDGCLNNNKRSEYEFEFVYCFSSFISLLNIKLCKTL